MSECSGDDCTHSSHGIEHPQHAAAVAPPPVKAQTAGATARCPECPWRGGPFTHPRHAQDALLKHINKDHAALIDYLRAKPLFSTNEGFARATVRNCIQQATKIRKAIDSPIATGPIDVPTEMIQFILNASNALAALADTVLEMRTGQNELIMQKKGDQAPEGQKGA